MLKLKQQYWGLVFILVANVSLFAQSDIKGSNLIEGYGATFEVPGATLLFGPGESMDIVFDIYDSPDDPSMLNGSLNTIARCYNMHIQAGFPDSLINLVGVVHNKAAYDIMNDHFYMQKHKVKNPNIVLIDLLVEKGVTFYLCGQSMMARKLPENEMLPGIKVALSAMTALSYFEKKNYTLIKF